MATVKTGIFLALVLALGLSGTAFGASAGVQLSGFLSTYISNSTISGINFTNVTVGNSLYSIGHVTANNYFIVNATSGKFSFVTSNATAFSVLSPYLYGIYYPSNATLASLSTTMSAYIKKANSTGLAECLLETGYTSGFTCTLANTCYSCSTAPICKKALNDFGGPTSTFGYGIMNLYQNYSILNRSYNQYFAALNGINRSNIISRASVLYNSIKSITATTTNFSRITVFPPPSNVTPTTIATCSNYAVTNLPWYCAMTGFCSTPTFNSTATNSITATVTGILDSPISNATVRAWAGNATSLAFSYYLPVLREQNGALFNRSIATLYPEYNSSVANATALLKNLQSASLSASLANLEKGFASFVSAGASQNVTVVTTQMKGLLSNLTAQYRVLAANFTPTYNLAVNNTQKLIIGQLNYQSVPSGIAQLASEQQALDLKLKGNLNTSELSSIRAQLQSISSQLNFYVPTSLPLMVKSFDSGFVNAMLSGQQINPASKIAAAPGYAAMLSFIIGIVILALIYFATYHRFNRRGKLRHTPGAHKAWRLLFIVLFIIVLAYAYETYALSSQANAFLPISSFVQQAGSQASLVIGVNGSANSSVSQCIAALNHTASTMSKAVQVISISANYSCSVSVHGLTYGGQSCYDYILSSGTPMVFIDSVPHTTSLIYKGLYGTVLYASGQAANGASCLANAALNTLR
ncbi:MAG: hypothetical protein KGH98_01225 [Candidatus Micrarchaeota archaeon]|nr:hypothetical protein [Candidatus Micrarchaeota archaeon]